MTLFGDEVGRPDAPERPPEVRDQAAHVVRVVPDVPAMNRELDYVVPTSLAAEVGVGSVVRVPLHGRRVRGWVVGAGGGEESPRELAELARSSGLGPDAEVIEVCRWVAWRWAGRLPSILRSATPPRTVRAPSRRPPRHPSGAPSHPDPVAAAAAELLARGPGVHVLGVSPATGADAAVLVAASLGQVLVVTPHVRVAENLVRLLGRTGATAARWPEGFASALAGHTVLGGRAAVFSPLPALAAVVVLDEHDEGLQSESSPTWHARDIAIERARRAGVPCLLVSPCPSLEALRAATSPVRWIPASQRRAGWASLRVIDRRDDDPRTGLYSSGLVEALRSVRAEGHSVLCVLNRTGRAKLLACRSCGTVAECERCGAAVASPDGDELLCPRCGSTRPSVCLSCSATAMKILRPGVTRAREELEALVGEHVAVVSAGRSEDGRAGVVIGTEAALHRGDRVTSSPLGLVAFLDFDQELLAARYRAAEEAMALLVLASRRLGGRADRAGIVVQTRRPQHPVLRAALRADPGSLSAAESVRREMLGLPPQGSVAAVGGEAAEEWIRRLGRPIGAEVNGPVDGWWLVRAPDPTTLADLCAAVSRPSGRLRLRVDPVRLP